MTSQITTVLADDHPLFRAGVRMVLEEDPNITIVGEAGNGREALALIERTTPVVAVLDIEMPELSGLKVAETLHEQGSATHVMILTMHDQTEFLDAATEVSVKGFLLKDAVESEILAAIHAVASGKYYFSPDLSGRVLQQSRGEGPRSELQRSLDVLTQREREIVALIAKGMTSREIANRLFLSRRTVENYRARICQKLSLSGSFGLLKFALEHKEQLSP